MSKSNYYREWSSHIRRDVVAGAVVALALIPEAIAFSIIAGVDPKVGLYASFCLAVIIAFVGGRPGMISAATGAMALLMVGKRRLEEQRGRLHEARRRIDAGTCGGCLRCGRDIAIERLEHQPDAFACMPCLAAASAKRGR